MAARRARRGHRQVELTRIEFALLELLMSYPHTVLTREANPFGSVGYDLAYASNSLEVYISVTAAKDRSGG